MQKAGGLFYGLLQLSFFDVLLWIAGVSWVVAVVEVEIDSNNNKSFICIGSISSTRYILGLVVYSLEGKVFHHFWSYRWCFSDMWEVDRYRGYQTLDNFDKLP